MTDKYLASSKNSEFRQKKLILIGFFAENSAFLESATFKLSLHDLPLTSLYFDAICFSNQVRSCPANIAYGLNARFALNFCLQGVAYLSCNSTIE